MERDSTSDTGEQATTEPAQRSDEWERVSQTTAYGELVRRKKAFVIPAVIFFTVAYLAWPALGSFTTVLDAQAVGAMTWAYVYGYVLWLAGSLGLLHLYMWQAAKWDRLTEKAREEASEGKTNA